MSIPEFTKCRRWLVGLMSCGVGLLLVIAACEPVSLPEFAPGQETTDNEPPTLTILQPFEDISISRGAGLVIAWIDTDRDTDATISFSLVKEKPKRSDPDTIIPLVDGISENPDGANDRFTISTQLVPLGSYTLRGRINDGVNRPVTSLAANRTVGLGEVVIRIVPPGGTSIANLPPQVFVREPSFNLSVSQDDVVTIVVQPTANDPNLDPALGPIVNDPYDVDSDALLYMVLDLDDDPLNDDVVAPDPSRIISLGDPTDPDNINRGDPTRRAFPITIDLERIPLRPDGSPYRIRATITDGQNPPVHAYAAGTLNVVRAASTDSGVFVDLGTVGKTTAGARFVGFNPGSNLGTRMVNLSDFDVDGIDDFCLVARFGNPRNFGNIGEAYVIYGQPGLRFGGIINVNSTAKAIPGFIVEAPRPRPFFVPTRTNTPNNSEGITDVAFIPDLNGDNRPELIFGTPLVDGFWCSRDDDPGDSSPEVGETLQVNVELKDGRDESSVTIEADPEDLVIEFTYSGMSDTVISSAQPNSNFRSADLEWVNVGAGNRKWTLLKLSDILLTFPPEDRPESIAEISGTLTLTVLDSGGQGAVHELLTDFNEATETFNTFGEPVAGVDYVEEPITTISADAPGSQVTVEMDMLLTRLIYGQLIGSRNEIRLIIVPGEESVGQDAADASRVASKEFSDPRLRPTLAIEYNRELVGGPLGCYPDPLPNNFSDEDNGDLGGNEDKFEAAGLVTLLASSNRDTAPLIADAPRLESTVVSLELIGARVNDGLEFDIDVIEQVQGDEPGRVEGARFQAGWYDFWDHLNLRQPPLQGLFGMSVASMPDVNLDGVPEVVVSSPMNERDYLNILSIPNATHRWGFGHFGSVTVIPGGDYDTDTFRDKGGDDGTTVIPTPADDNERYGGEPGDCGPPGRSRAGPLIVKGTWEIFAEDPDDYLGGARSPGDFNLDSIPDIICGAPRNDRSEDLPDTGAMYVIYGRSPVGNVLLATADDPLTRPPMLRIRGEKPGDGIGWKQEPVADVNGDGIDDVLFSSPTADFILPAPACLDASFDGALDPAFFNSCLSQREVFSDDVCKNFDYNNDRVVDNADRDVFNCLFSGGNSRECCPADNGYVGVIFGGVNRQGDRTISQLGTNELGGVVFYGSNAGDRAGYDISSAGDFDKDGFGDILISAPGEFREDANARLRMGVVYLIYGGPHLDNQEVPIELSEIGDRVPGLVFLSPYPAGAPDEAPTDFVGFLGDINADGFGDIAIGSSRADLLDEEFPQGDGTPNETGRRLDQGDAYIIYGNNVGRP